MAVQSIIEAEFAINIRAITAYSRLSYTMWHALAEFLDNSTQSRLNYASIVDEVLAQEGLPLIVNIEHNRVTKEIRIEDNSIGMTVDDLIQALQIANPTADSKGRSKYGMGLKTAACWIGGRWNVVTCEWGSGEEWTAAVDVEALANGSKIPLTMKTVDTDAHYTHIIISDLHRNIQKRTEVTIRNYLGSMYRFDLQDGNLRILYNNEEVFAPDEYDFDTDPSGSPMRMDLPPQSIGDKTVKGWAGVLRKGGRRFGGFSLFQNRRQIQGFPNAWRPRSIYGGVDGEGANNLVSQRLVGLLELDGFAVSHTKDTIQYEGDEEETLENFLVAQTQDYRNYAMLRRGQSGQPWSREKLRDLLDSMKKEFTSAEIKDAVTNSILPPFASILENNAALLARVSDEDTVQEYEVTPELRIRVAVIETSEFEPYVTITASADPGTVYIIVNGLHPYYSSLDSTDAIEECFRQYIYDAVSEYQVTKLKAVVSPDSVRRVKDTLLRAQIAREGDGPAISDNGHANNGDNVGNDSGG